jgi:cytidyltransferase-like protein
MAKLAPAEILPLEELCVRRGGLGRVACTSGGFDPLHSDHVRLLLSAKDYCDAFVVFVSSDDFLRRKKGRPFMEQPFRCALVAGIRGVDYVIAYENEEDQTISNGLRLLRPEVFLKGGDRLNRETIPEWDLCESLGIRVVVPEHCREVTTINGVPCHGSVFIDRCRKAT